MKRNLLILLLSLFSICCVFGQEDIDVLLLKLDGKIANREEFIAKKEHKIAQLINQKKTTKGSLSDGYTINKLLIEEYRSYSSDSAIHYFNLNEDIAKELNDIQKINETSLTYASLFVRLGMYKEASDLLESLDVKRLNSVDSIAYHSAWRELYLGMGHYGLNTREKNKYWALAKKYDEKVQSVLDTTSEEYLRSKEKGFRLSGDFVNALAINDKRLSMTEANTMPYAFVAFHRSLIYRKMGDVENEKKYLILSALSDIDLSIKDNASISILADILAKEGDINRAYKYIRYSLDNIQDFNTRIRSAEILNIQNIIDKEFQLQNEKRSAQLLGLLIVVSILSICLIIAVIYVYKQMKKGQAISLKLKVINEELEHFNTKLNSMNLELISRNREVAEANHIKEEYIAYFLDACSSYIVKLDDYRRMVYTSIQDKQVEQLKNLTRDNSLKERELKELFTNFDSMFFNLFPNFLQEFNKLLLEEEQINLKKDKELNTELRIFALIRLGINDSSKIANFLGYSVNTIYNYRTKMKNRAKVSREDFEQRVMKIGTFM